MSVSAQILFQGWGYSSQQASWAFKTIMRQQIFILSSGGPSTLGVLESRATSSRQDLPIASLRLPGVKRVRLVCSSAPKGFASEDVWLFASYWVWLSTPVSLSTFQPVSGVPIFLSSTWDAPIVIWLVPHVSL